MENGIVENEIDILKYIKGSAPLEERKKFLFDLIDKLDKESLKIFSEVINANDFDFYNMTDLTYRLNKLNSITSDTIDAFDYLSDIETDSYRYAVNRFRFKIFLSLVATGFAFSSNAILGICTFAILNTKAKNDYVGELNLIDRKVNAFDSEKLNKVGNTITNATRIYNYKIERIKETFSADYNEIKDGSEDTLISLDFLANMSILLYKSGELNPELVEAIPVEVKNIMIEILNKDLGTESDNLNELLEEFVKRGEENISLIKKFKTREN